jgi:hypothetical protein
MLMLARIDGKSPVEYLRSQQQADWVRQFARSGILAAISSLSEISDRWFTKINEAPR